MARATGVLKTKDESPINIEIENEDFYLVYWLAHFSRMIYYEAEEQVRNDSNNPVSIAIAD